uniref:Uncharacterized protein n=1 Tax=Oryza sativa subsp. japonica TaxID=39947 RepID=Q6K8Y1_ORYSJ|nr:hypothetical protein [Oryza sativa Japonica Group]BAD19279.1 hypothetical protein [Oryza sativa Japonica Group]
MGNGGGGVVCSAPSSRIFRVEISLLSPGDSTRVRSGPCTGVVLHLSPQIHPTSGRRRRGPFRRARLPERLAIGAATGSVRWKGRERVVPGGNELKWGEMKLGAAVPICSHPRGEGGWARKMPPHGPRSPVILGLPALLAARES